MTDGREKKLLEYNGEDKIISSQEMQEIIRLQKNTDFAITSAYPLLDVALGGFEGGEVTVISGLTGQGKTLFAQSLTRTFWLNDINSTWFSFEVSPKWFLRTFGENLPVFYMPARLKDNTLDWLHDRIHEGLLKYSSRVVFIDHLHFLVDMRTRNNMSLEIGFTMRALKKIALKHNLCLFLIAHTEKTKAETELDVSNLRDSSFIGQEADNVLMIWRDLKTENEAWLKVVKNRKRGVFTTLPLTKVDGFLVAGNNERKEVKYVNA